MDELEQNIRFAIGRNFYNRYANIYNTNPNMRRDIINNVNSTINQKCKELEKEGLPEKTINVLRQIDVVKIGLFTIQCDIEIIREEWRKGRSMYSTVFNDLKADSEFPKAMELLNKYMARKDNIVDFIVQMGPEAVYQQDKAYIVDKETLSFAMNWEFKTRQGYIGYYKDGTDSTNMLDRIINRREKARFAKESKESGEIDMALYFKFGDIMEKYFLDSDLEAFF